MFCWCGWGIMTSVLLLDKQRCFSLKNTTKHTLCNRLKPFVLEQHNPAFHPAGIVGSGALRNHISKPIVKTATSRTRTGLIASQKAVHAHPDHVSSWAVLAASVTAHNIATDREGLGPEKNGLGARLSQFVELTGIKYQNYVIFPFHLTFMHQSEEQADFYFV